jgi:hypothetical protein
MQSAAALDFIFAPRNSTHMSRAIRIFFVHDDDSIERIAVSRYERLVGRRDVGERWPEHAGKRLRYALLVVEQDADAGEDPRVIHTEFGFLTFDAEGRRDKESAEKTMRDAFALLGGRFPTDKTESNVVGEQAFRQRRYKLEHRWEPTDEVVRRLGEAATTGKRPARRARPRRQEVSPA